MAPAYFLPPPREPQHSEERCYCVCHATNVADLEAGVYWRDRLDQPYGAAASRRDPVDAASACPRCLKLHTLTFAPPLPEPPASPSLPPPFIPPSGPFKADTEDD